MVDDMIVDMTHLKLAMEQMDAEDPSTSQAGKDRAAQILGEAKLSFAKLAELIEQRRLLLKPAILARIKRMDQPGMLGDAAFRDTGSALRKEGQSFHQIAEAIEASAGAAIRREDPAQPGTPLQQMASETDDPAWMTALVVLGGIITFPLRHPLRFVALALLATLLFYGTRGAVAVVQHASVYLDGTGQRIGTAIASVTDFVNGRILRPSTETAAPPTPPSPIPSPSVLASSLPTVPSSTSQPAAPTTAAVPPATASAPAATEQAPAAAAPPAPPATQTNPIANPTANPPVATSRRDARGAPRSKAAATSGQARDEYAPWPRRGPSFDDDRRPRTLADVVPAGMRRNSRGAGPCIAGVGGCYGGGIDH
jgi:hypothetical protein